LNYREDFPIENAWTFAQISRNFWNFVASGINIFGFEIEAPFGLLSGAREQKESGEIEWAMWLQCGRLTIRSS